MRLIFRNIFFYAILICWTVCIPFFVLPFLAFRGWLRGEPLYVAVRRANYYYGAGWRWCIRPWAAVSCIIENKKSFPAPCIIVANHQSFFDTHCMGSTPNSHTTFTVRSWPFKIPFYGTFMRMARYTDVESLEPETVLERLREDAAHGAAIVFFPEAHRQQEDRIGRFHAGAFAAAVALKLPIVPLCIRGSGTVLPPGAPWIYPGRIRIRALPTVDPALFAQEGDGGARALRKYVHARMREAFAEMG